MITRIATMILISITTTIMMIMMAGVYVSFETMYEVRPDQFFWLMDGFFMLFTITLISTYTVSVYREL